MKVAAIDCGTNSMRLLIATIDGRGKFTEVLRCLRVVRLGAGVDRSRVLSQEALERSFGAGREYAGLIRKHGVALRNFRCVATSAVRDAENKQEFIDGMRGVLGVEPEIVTGVQEAELSFNGAMRALDGFPRPSGNILVVDLGGGSTEFVAGTMDNNGNGRVVSAVSVDIGCVRMRERFIGSDPPTSAETEALQGAVIEKLEPVAREIDFGKIGRVIGVAGTITTVTASVLGLDSYDASKINGATVAIEDIINGAGRLARMDCNERAGESYVHPGRVDVLGAGALIYQTIMEEIVRYTKGAVDSLTTSEYDILDGIAISIAG